MRSVAIASLAVFVLAGCAAQQAAQYKAERDAELAKCKAEFPSAPGSYTPQAKCRVAAMDKYAERVGTPGDIQSSYDALFLLEATKLDAGAVTKEQANVELAQKRLELNEIMRGRRQQNAAAAAALLSAMHPMPVYQAPAPYVMPTQTYRPPMTTNCMSMGSNMMSCTSQ